MDLGLNSGLLIISTAFLPLGKFLRSFPSLSKIKVENTTQLELLKGLKIAKQHMACTPWLAPMGRCKWALLPGTRAIYKVLLPAVSLFLRWGLLSRLYLWHPESQTFLSSNGDRWLPLERVSNKLRKL